MDCEELNLKRRLASLVDGLFLKLPAEEFDEGVEPSWDPLNSDTHSRHLELVLNARSKWTLSENKAFLEVKEPKYRFSLAATCENEINARTSLQRKLLFELAVKVGHRDAQKRALASS